MQTLAFRSSSYAYRSSSGLQRYGACALVMLLHLGLIVALLWPREAAHRGPSLTQPLQVRIIAPAQPAKPQPPEPTQPQVKPQPSTPVTLSSITLPPPAASAAAEPAPELSAAAPAAMVSEPEAHLVPPDFRAAYLNNPGPAYPYASKRQREEGEVLLRVQVSEDGRPLQVLVERSSGYARLDEAAVAVVAQRWRFVPAQQNGRAVQAWVLVPMIFELRKR